MSPQKMSTEIIHFKTNCFRLYCCAGKIDNVDIKITHNVSKISLGYIDKIIIGGLYLNFYNLFSVIRTKL